MSIDEQAIVDVLELVTYNRISEEDLQLLLMLLNISTGMDCHALYNEYIAQVELTEDANPIEVFAASGAEPYQAEELAGLFVEDVNMTKIQENRSDIKVVVDNNKKKVY